MPLSGKDGKATVPGEPGDLPVNVLLLSNPHGKGFEEASCIICICIGRCIVHGHFLSALA